MSIKYKQKRQEKTRLDFLQAALQLILERGYDALTVADIAERADYGRSTFYNYFNDKEDLVWAIFEHFMGLLDAHIIESVEHLPSPEREYASWLIIFENIGQQRDFFLQMEGHESLTLQQIMRRYLVEQFKGHLEAGRFSLLTSVKPEIAAQFFVATILELMSYWLHHPEYGTAQDIANDLFILVFRQAPPMLKPGQSVANPAMR
jgi:AcrR family transcriptional regulator